MSEICCKGTGETGTRCEYDDAWFCKNPDCKSPVLTSTMLGAHPSGCPKFTTGTEGQVNRMSDDLISRKEAIDILENMIFEVGKDLSKSHLLQDARKRIIGLNTAFDKEKVIEELDKLTGEDCTLHECGIRSERCKPCIAKKAVEIVKKGGLI